MSLASTQDIIHELKQGRMVVLVDEEDRENEGDLVMAAEFVTPAAVNFMAKFGRGLICLTLTEEHCQRLQLPLMVGRNGSSFGTNFTVSIEAATGVSTGISAHDRAHTITTAIARHAKASDIVQPGHVFPLMAQRGGVLARAGHTEAGCDLAALAGLTPAAVICEILNEDGSMARLPDLQVFAHNHGLKIGAIRDLIEYRHQHESLVQRQASRPLQTAYGEFTMHAYRDCLSEEIHYALVWGQIKHDRETLVRVHEPFSAADGLDSLSMHSWSLPQALRRIAQAESGVLMLLHRGESNQELFGRLFPEPNQRVPRWDQRTYGLGAQILKHLGVGQMRLMAHPVRIPSMAGFNLEITGFLEPEKESA